MSYLEFSPVPRSVAMSGSLQVAKLDLVGSIGAANSHRKFNLEKLVRFCPLNLKLEDAARFFAEKLILHASVPHF